MDKLKMLVFIFPVMGYYLLESVIISIFVTVIWKYFLFSIINVSINYVQWTLIIWIVKMLLFDVFKLINSLPTPQLNNDLNK